MDHILSKVLFTPLVGLLLLLFIPSSNARAIKLWANAASFAGFLVSLPLVFNFDRTKDFQFVEKAPWIPTLGATYHIGIDGLGLLLVMLTTLVGFISIRSVLMFLGILTLYFQHYMQFQVYSFDIADLMRTQVSASVQWWVFWAFFVGFAVKVPMFPFHTWLPDAHTEAPTAGSVI